MTATAPETREALIARAADRINLAHWCRRKRLFARAIAAEREALELAEAAKRAAGRAR